MNDLLITFREKGKKKGFIFNEKQIKRRKRQSKHRTPKFHKK